MSNMEFSFMDDQKDRVLTKATLRAAESLGIGIDDLAEVLGVNARYLDLCVSGGGVLRDDSESGVQARDFVRVALRVVGVFGTEGAVKWVSSHNYHLGSTPVETMKNPQGVTVIEYYLGGLDRFGNPIF